MKEEIEKIEEKANYCLNCKIKPCSQKGCPLGNNIPEFIRLVKEEEYEEAYKVLSETTVLQAICGRICPHKKQCQGSCVRGIKGEPVSIGDIEAFVGDKAIENNYKLFEDKNKLIEDELCESFEKISKNSHDRLENNKVSMENKKVAIVGGGPAGLTCAAFLAKEGVEVTIYERYDKLGGLLVYGIPEFRLPKDIVKSTIQKILDLGVNVEYNRELGKNLEIAELEEKYDMIFLSFGANQSTKMGVEGEELDGVYGGNELLEYNQHPDYSGKVVAVVGGGNVAMDCARTIKRLGAKKVKVIYRRAEEQMPAEEKEVKDAKEEGIEFLFQNNISKIMGQDKVEKVELIKTTLIQKEGETRLVPVNVEGSNYVIDVDYIVMALGSKPAEFVKDLGLELNKWGNIAVNEKGQTSNPKIFAGGDIAGVKSTVAWAAKSGRDVAYEVLKRF